MLRLFLLGALASRVFGSESGWPSQHFPVWNFGIASHLDLGPLSDPRQHFAADLPFDGARFLGLEAGATAWILPDQFEEFCTEVLPQLASPLVLVIAGGDETFPEDCCDQTMLEEALASPFLGHIFAQNLVYSGPGSTKISPLPIGINFHTMAFERRPEASLWGGHHSLADQAHALEEAARLAPPIEERKLAIFADFQHTNSMRHSISHWKQFARWQQFGEDRQTIFEHLAALGVVDSDKRMSRFDLWHRKAQYAFSVSPPGNGLDCYRTWEDLFLGCIVIVKRVGLADLYRELPVIEVDSWDEVTTTNLARWHEDYSPMVRAGQYRCRLNNSYWVEQIKAKGRAIKEAFMGASPKRESAARISTEAAPRPTA